MPYKTSVQSNLANGRIAVLSPIGALGKHIGLWVRSALMRRYVTMVNTCPPQKCPFTRGDLDPNTIHASLDPYKSTLKTASWSVQPFFAQLTRVPNTQTQADRHTDILATYMAIGRIRALHAGNTD